MASAKSILALQVRTPSQHWLVGVYSDPQALLRGAQAYRELDEAASRSCGESADQAWLWRCLEAVECALDLLPSRLTGGIFDEGRPIVWEGPRAQSIGKAT